MKPRRLCVETLESRTLMAADFGVPEMLEAGNYPSSTALGDLNGDRVADIVVQDVGNRAFRTYLSAGKRGFNPGETVQATGQEIGTPSLLDFNRDGRLDLAAQVGNDAIAVWLGSGKGTFATRSTATVQGLVGHATADFNGDGFLDLAGYRAAVSTGSDSVQYDVQLLLGRGDGTFSTGSTINLARTFGYKDGGLLNVSLVASDVTSDGNADILVSLPRKNVLHVVRGNGNGTFQAPTNQPLAQGYTAVLGDMNGDGRLDLAVANRSLDRVTIHSGDGAGNFAVSQSVAVGDEPVDLVVADFDGNGKLDFLTANRGPVGTTSATGDSVTLALNSGSGFTTQNLMVGDPNNKAIQPSDAAVGDVDGDGNLDIVVGHNYVNPIPKSPDPVKSSSKLSIVRGGSAAQPGMIEFANGSYRVDEGGRSVTLSVKRTRGSDGDVEVYFRTFGYVGAQGKAAPSSDYTHTAGWIKFGKGETSRTIAVPIVDDNDIESDELFQIDLFTPTGGAKLGSLVTAQITIVENDAKLAGTVFHDQNGNRANDASEVGLANRIVYVDANNNGRLDANEARAQTNSNGKYSFVVRPGTYRIRLVADANWQNTTNVSFELTVRRGQLNLDRNFGQRRRS